MLHVVTSVQETAGFFKAKKNALRIVRSCGRPLRSAAGSRRSAGASERSRPEKAGILRSGVSPARSLLRAVFSAPKAKRLAGEEPAAPAYSMRGRASSAPCHAQEGPAFQGSAFGYGANSLPGVKDRPDPRSEPPPALHASCGFWYIPPALSRAWQRPQGPPVTISSEFLEKNKLFLQNYLAFCSCL